MEATTMCSYQHCHLPVNTGYSDTLCIFHCPREAKGIDAHAFEALIQKQIGEGGLDFTGYIFPWSISFNLMCATLKQPNFKYAVFEDYADFSSMEISTPSFWHTQFKSFARFEGIQFTGDKVEFRETVFFGSVFFDGSEFRCKSTIFDRVRIKGEHFTFLGVNVRGNFAMQNCCITVRTLISFQLAVFDQRAVFARSVLIAPQIRFHSCVFDATVLFEDVKVGGSSPVFNAVSFCDSFTMNVCDFRYGFNFSQCTFEGRKTLFASISVSSESLFSECFFSGKSSFERLRLRSTIKFLDLRFGNDATFRFAHPIILKGPTAESPARIEFADTLFNPHRTTFEGVDGDVFPIFMLEFNHCTIDGISIIRSNLRAFRFANTRIGGIIFTSCHWPVQTERILGVFSHVKEGVLGEEAYLQALDYHNSEVLEKLRDQYGQMKVALDSQHEYVRAGQFYYNRCETERRIARVDGANRIFRKRWYNRFRNPYRKEFGFQKYSKRTFARELSTWISAWSRWFLFTLYKFGSGYGEKPHWSFGWLVTSVCLFTALNLRVGFLERVTSARPKLIQYLWPNWCSIHWPASEDLLNSFTYTLGHLNLIRQLFGDGSSSAYSPIGAYGMLLHSLESGVLLIFLTLTLVGLQRRFKRF